MKSFQVGQKILLGVKTLDELPENARHYVERVSQLTGIPFIYFLCRSRSYIKQMYYVVYIANDKKVYAPQ